MKDNTYDLIKNLEHQLEKGMPFMIFKGYTASNKRGVEKLIHDLYSSLPNDVKISRNYLNNIEEIFNNGFHIAKLVFVNIQQIEQILDKIYQTLPEEISEK